MKTKKLTALTMLFLACGPLVNPPPCESGEVAATLSSVTLAHNCPDAKVAQADRAICATEQDCDGLCRQTSMQLAFKSAKGSAAKVEILDVRLLDIDTRQVLEHLSHREPSQWSVDKYMSWNETVPAGASLQTSYKLSAPNFNSQSSLAALQKYIVEVDVAIDGDVRTLSIEATREPEVAT